jgi:hypothetical protein
MRLGSAGFKVPARSSFLSASETFLAMATYTRLDNNGNTLYTAEYDPARANRRLDAKAAARSKRFHENLDKRNAIRRDRGEKLIHTTPPPDKTKLPAVTKIAHIECPEFTAEATFKRQKGVWHCIAADQPVEWFTRTKSQTISDWLFRKHARIQWRPAEHTPGNNIPPAVESTCKYNPAA